MDSYDRQVLRDSWTVYRWSNMADWTYYNGQYTFSKHVHLVSSVRTPNFRNLKKSDLPVNVYSKNQSFMDSNEGVVYCNLSGNGSTGVLSIQGGVETFGSTVAAIPWESDIATICSQKLLRSLNSSKTNTLVSLAEAHKTAASVYKNATKIANALLALKKLDFPRFTSALGITAKVYQKKEFGKKRSKLVHELVGPEWDLMSKSTRRYTSKRVLLQEKHQPKILDFMADTWLEYSYGWKPLLGDVYSHAEALATVMVDRDKIAVRSIFATVTLNRTLSEYARGENLWAVSRKTDHVHSARMGVHYKLGDNSTLSTAAVFGLTNPYIVAWELVPFSFVADWFLPIGTALESITASDGLVFLKGFTGGKQSSITTTRVSRNDRVIDSGGYIHSGGGGLIEATARALSFTRFPLNSFPNPTLPKWKDPRSFAHAASAISLLQSIFLRK